MNLFNKNYAGQSFSIEITENGFILNYNNNCGIGTNQRVFSNFKDLVEYAMKTYGMLGIGEEIEIKI